MNKGIKIPNIILLVVGGLVGIAYYSISKFDFIGTKSPEYFEHIQERINFSTTKACDNTLQWDTLTKRINTFFEKNSQYALPDSIDVGVPEYIGEWAGFDKAIYFDSIPKEIYIASFNSSAPNHIDFIYTFHDGELIKKKTDTLSNEEKNRVRLRLESNIISKIDWNVSHIQF